MAHTTSDSLKIAQKAKLLPIEKVAKKMGVRSKYIELYGNYKAKISLDILKSLRSRKDGKYIFVTAITPTPLGEGKTVTTLGLAMAMHRLGKKVAACIRQPSLGPVFGIKGGASGGGHAQVVPMEDVNLHLIGDFHAVSVAHNLCAAYFDNAIFRGNPLDIDMGNITWNRVVDVNDRFLRNISIGMGTKNDGITRRSGFSITAASELIAILALSESLHELRTRIGKIIVAYTKKGKPVTTEDIKVAGPMTVLLRDAIKPNLLQTLVGSPCFVHTGPFANIAHGNSSIIADKIAIKLCDYVVTEGGFGADIGAEKFFNIKCRASKLKPSVAVLVCSIRALKVHSGDFEVKNAKSLNHLIFRENISAVERGCSNLDKHIENIKAHGVPVVVCVNQFETDTEKEIQAVKRSALAAGADAVATSNVYMKGAEGGEELAKTVIDVLKKKKSSFRFLYPLDLSIKEKILRIAKTIYGAKEVVYSEVADKKMRHYKSLKFDKLPICMAKTQYSLSHDPKRKGRPKNFKLQVVDINLSAGAGFLYVLCGDIKTMPGLPKVPRGFSIDIDKHGQIIGLQ